VGGAGHVAVNGQSVQTAVAGVTRVRVPITSTDNVVEAVVAEAKGQEGTWRFELTGGNAVLGGLSAQAGNVVQVAGHTIVFRLSGKPGEVVAFRFTARR